MCRKYPNSGIEEEKEIEDRKVADEEDEAELDDEDEAVRMTC